MNAEAQPCFVGAKSKLQEILRKKKASGDDEMSRTSELIRTPGANRWSDRYTALADDSATSEAKRAASMMLSAAEGLLEDGEPQACVKMAEDAIAKFNELGDQGAEGEADALHIVVDAFRLEAYIKYREPFQAQEIAQRHLKRYRDAGDRRGEATMLLATAEIRTDDPRLGKRREALEPITQALAAARECGDRKLEAKCLIESTFVAYSLNEPDRMLEDAEAALTICDEFQDICGKGQALYAIALSYVRVNDWATAVENASMAQQAFEQAGKANLEAGVLHAMASWRLLSEQPKKAVPLAERALERCHDRGARAQAVIAFTLCEAQTQAKNFRAALKVAGDFLDRFQGRSFLKEQAMMQEALTFAHAASDCYEKAARTIELARSIAEELGEKRYESRVLVIASVVHLKGKDRAEASQALMRAIDLADEEGDLYQLATAQRELATLHMFDSRDFNEGMRLASIAFDTAKEDGDLVAQGAATLQVAFCHFLMDELEKAVASCSDAQDMFQQVTFPEGEAQALWMFAELKVLDGKCDAALEAAQERLSLCKQLNDVKMQVKALQLISSIHLKDQNYDQAEQACLQALALCQDADVQPLEMDSHLALVLVYLDQATTVTEDEWKSVLAKAAKSANDAVAVSIRLGEKSPRGVALYWKAQTLMMQQKFQDAQRTATEAEALFRNVQSQQGQGASLHLIGAMQGVFDQADRALETFDKALALAQACRDGILEMEVSASIFNIQKRAPSQQQAMMPAQQQMMPGQQQMMGDAIEGVAEASMVPAQPKGLDPEFVRIQLVRMVKDVVVSDEELELDTPFMEAGLDSLSSVSLMSSVAKEFQMALSPSLVFDFPSVRALEDHLVEESRQS